MRLQGANWRNRVVVDEVGRVVRRWAPRQVGSWLVLVHVSLPGQPGGPTRERGEMKYPSPFPLPSQTVSTGLQALRGHTWDTSHAPHRGSAFTTQPGGESQRKRLALSHIS